MAHINPDEEFLQGIVMLNRMTGMAWPRKQCPTCRWWHIYNTCPRCDPKDDDYGLRRKE